MSEIINHVILNGSKSLTEREIKSIIYKYATVEIDEKTIEKINKSEAIIKKQVEDGNIIYGVTTGFGSNATKVIDKEDAEQLQENLLLSHACGVGKFLPDETVRMIILLRIINFCKGYSGVKLDTVNFLISLLNKRIHPLVPEQGSVGSSGDLVPLSHIGITLLGKGYVRYNNVVRKTYDVLEEVGLEKIKLSYKEGLALNNGTSAMTAIGILGMYEAKKLMKLTDLAASLTIEAVGGRDKAFEKKVHELRPHKGQIDTALNINKILNGSYLFGVNPSDIKGKKNSPQDSYSIRCTPQIHGASKNTFKHVYEVVKTELNSVTDNPIVFEDGDVISAGHFHGQPIALTMDYMKLAISELGNVSERRIAKLIDSNHNEGMPDFLVTKNGGLNSGFMIPQYVAASLVSENKVLVHPASSDSIPTSANIEDHVSMGTIAARQFIEIMNNVYNIIAIEFLNNTQAIDIRKRQLGEFKMGLGTEIAYNLIRDKVEFLEDDRFLYPDIKKISDLIKSDKFISAIEDITGEIIV